MRLVWILLAGALAGCASGPTGDPPASAPPRVAWEVEALSDAHHDDRFAPASLTARIGEEVTFRVVGSTPHTVDFEETDGVVGPHSGNLDEGMTHGVTFTKPGTYLYYCQYHIPGMRGTITIEP